MSGFEITRGDYGIAYTGIIEGVDLSACSAKIYIWNGNDVILVNGKTCTVTFVTPDTHIIYIPEAADFATATVAGIYHGVFVLIKFGAQETLKPFSIQILAKPPGT